MPYTYRISVQQLAADATVGMVPSLVFDVFNHDEIVGLVDRVAAREVVLDSEVAEFTIGLKLFSEIMLRHRSEPLFADLVPHFHAFMKRLKCTPLTDIAPQ